MFPMKSLLRGVQALHVSNVRPNNGNVASLASKTLAELAGMPVKPKKPLTPFFRYMQEQRPSVLAKNPHVKSSDIVRVLAESWKTVDDAKRRKFEESFAKERDAYIIELVKYQNSLTPEMKEDLARVRHDRAERRARLLVRKRNRDLDKPRRPLNAFLLFTQHQYKVNEPKKGESVANFNSQCAKKWKSMSETERKPFMEEATKNSAKYKTDIEKWTARMIKEGHTDVIRHPLSDETPKVSTGPKRKAK